MSPGSGLDEVGALREALGNGDWRRLLDPLLTLALLDDPAGVWWRFACSMCAESLLSGCGYHTSIITSQRVMLAWLRDLADTRCLAPDELAALEVLERWPG